MLQIVFMVSLGSSWPWWVHGLWFHDVWTYGATVLEYWMISSLKIKLNCSWNFWRNCNVPLVSLERSWWAGFNGIYFTRFEFRIVGDIDCRMISAAENSNKFQKIRFWKEKAVQKVATLWRLTIQFKHDFLSYLAVQKIDTYIAKQCSHVEFPYFVMGSHLL